MYVWVFFVVLWVRTRKFADVLQAKHFIVGKQLDRQKILIRVTWPTERSRLKVMDAKCSEVTAEKNDYGISCLYP